MELQHFIFWFSVAGLFYTYAGYPMMMACLASVRRKLIVRTGEAVAAPSVTVVLVVHNEGGRIARRIENLLGSNYSHGCIEVLVVSDGSTDGTLEIASGFSNRGVLVMESAGRRGKAACLNLAAKAPKGEIVVFTDARQRFAQDTISRLTAWFDDPKVGSVSGNLSIEASGSSVGKGVDAYWKIERSLRENEARYDSSIGCTGAVYAIRSDLFQGIPDDTILDDVVIPMLAAVQGYRVVFDREACAYDPQALEPEKERIRKRRTLAGNFQMFFRYPEWLLPWRNRLWWQLISHKYFRLISPGFLIAMFFSNLLVVGEWPYTILFLGQIAFFTLGSVGLLVPGIRRAWLSIPSGFLFLNWMVVEAFQHFAFGPKGAGWGSVKTTERAPTR